MPNTDAQPHYEYTVMTRDNAAACGLAPEWWANHPDWDYFVRTNHKCPTHGGGKCWVSGGGKTLEEAAGNAVFHLRQCIFPDQPGEVVTDGEVTLLRSYRLVGRESATVIQD